MTIGIITEFNPLHNGHKYLIDTIRSKYKDATIIIAMSGDFVQRGEGAILDKYKRASMAIDAGVNIVVQIPTVFALSSANYFAFGAINTLIKLGVDKIIFGMEANNINDLTAIATFLNNETDEFKERIKAYLLDGLSYPKARMLAIRDCYNNSFIEEMNSSNNILAIEYIRHILLYNESSNKKVTYEGIIRQGQNYNDSEISNKLTSAKAIRNALFNNNTLKLKDCTTSFSYKLLMEAYNENSLVFTDDFSDILFYKLLDICKYQKQDAIDKLLFYNDMSEFLAASIYTKFINWEEDFKITSFINSLKSKNYTYSRISRCLFSIILGIRKKDVKEEIHFINLLSFDNKGRDILSHIKKELDIPLISKNSKGKYIKEFLDESYMSDLYNSVVAKKIGRAYKRDIKKSIVKN